MDGRASCFSCWATSSLSALFNEAPLLSATLSLGSHFSGLLLLQADSQLALLYSFCNPKAQEYGTTWSRTTFRASVTMRLAMSRCNPGLPGASQHHSCFAARSRFLKSSCAFFANSPFFQRRSKCNILFNILEVEPSLQSSAPFVDHLPRSRREPAETKTPLSGHHEPHCPKKKHRVSRPKAFSPLYSHVPELLHFPTT